MCCVPLSCEFIDNDIFGGLTWILTYCTQRVKRTSN